MMLYYCPSDNGKLAFVRRYAQELMVPVIDVPPRPDRRTDPLLDVPMRSRPIKIEAKNRLYNQNSGQ